MRNKARNKLRNKARNTRLLYHPRTGLWFHRFAAGFHHRESAKSAKASSRPLRLRGENGAAHPPNIWITFPRRRQ
jgi:hypothetical protein